MSGGVSTEELERFAAEHGIPALLDHLGLDGLGNEVNALYRAVEACMLGIAAARAHAEGLRMDTPEDEAVRLKLVETLRLASVLLHPEEEGKPK